MRKKILDRNELQKASVAEEIIERGRPPWRGL